MSKRILVVEDDPDISRLMALHLKDLNYQVSSRADGNEAWHLIEHESFDLVILDLMLPGMDGLEFCRRLRHQAPHIPVVMVTSKSAEVDRVLGLEVGADDYVTKPFSMRELMARVKALFRRLENRQQTPARESTLQHGELRIEPSERGVTLSGRRVDLTAKEFDLLLTFCRQPGRVYSRAQLLDQVWGYGHAGYEHTVNSHINRLRAKIEEDPTNPRYILTVWGVGYKFSPTPC